MCTYCIADICSRVLTISNILTVRMLKEKFQNFKSIIFPIHVKSNRRIDNDIRSSFNSY